MRIWFAGPRLPLGMRASKSLNLAELGARKRQPVATEHVAANDGAFLFVVTNDKCCRLGASQDPRLEMTPGATLIFAGVTPGDGKNIEAKAKRVLAKHHLGLGWFAVSPEAATATLFAAAASLSEKLVAVAPNAVGRIVRKARASRAGLAVRVLRAMAWTVLGLGVAIILAAMFAGR